MPDDRAYGVWKWTHDGYVSVADIEAAYRVSSFRKIRASELFIPAQNPDDAQNAQPFDEGKKSDA